jgi:hypothetical protein
MLDKGGRGEYNFLVLQQLFYVNNRINPILIDS